MEPVFIGQQAIDERLVIGRHHGSKRVRKTVALKRQGSSDNVLQVAVPGQYNALLPQVIDEISQHLQATYYSPERRSLTPAPYCNFSAIWAKSTRIAHSVNRSEMP